MKNIAQYLAHLQIQRKVTLEGATYIISLSLSMLVYSGIKLPSFSDHTLKRGVSNFARETPHH